MALYTFQKSTDQFFARTPWDIVNAIAEYKRSPELKSRLLQIPWRTWLQEEVEMSQIRPLENAVINYNLMGEVDLVEVEGPEGTVEYPLSFNDLQLTPDFMFRLCYNSLPGFIELQRSIGQAKRGPLYEIAFGGELYEAIVLVPEDVMQAIRQVIEPLRTTLRLGP